jgi:hypothetical protein
MCNINEFLELLKDISSMLSCWGLCPASIIYLLGVPFAFAIVLKLTTWIVFPRGIGYRKSQFSRAMCVALIIFAVVMLAKSNLIGSIDEFSKDLMKQGQTTIVEIDRTSVTTPRVAPPPPDPQIIIPAPLAQVQPPLQVFYYDQRSRMMGYGPRVYAPNYYCRSASLPRLPRVAVPPQRWSGKR